MMITKEIECDFGIEQELSGNHSKLIDAVQKFDKGQRVKKPCRSEPSLGVSEFHLVKSGITNQNVIETIDLAKTLKEKRYHTDISKKIKTNVISKPLEKPIVERIKRVVGFENSKKKLGRWTAIIARNRTAATITLPFSQSMKLQSTNECIKGFRLQSELEQKLSEVEPATNMESDKNNFLLTLQEISERKNEAARLRAQQSYKEAKAYRQNKIKSKIFHRIQRKEKIRKSLKEFDNLQKTDPCAALEKLEQLNKIRIRERMTLRHKNTGHWAKSKLIKSKYDNDIRQMLLEQLSIGKELEKKIEINEDSEGDNDNHYQQICFLSNDKDNPWLKSANNQSEINDFINSYQKYWDKVKKINNYKIVSKDDKKVITGDEHESGKKFIELSEYLPGAGHFTKKIEELSSQEFKNINAINSNIDGIKKKSNSINHSKGIKKLSENSRYKFEKNILKKKFKAHKEKSGTSFWMVSSIDTLKEKILNVKNNIDEPFQLLDNKLQKQLSSKYLKFKSSNNQENKYLMEMVNKKAKIKNIPATDIEALNLKGQTKLKPMINKPIEEIEIVNSLNLNLQTDQSASKSNSNDCAFNSMTTEIDPKNFINIMPKYLKSHIPDNDGETIGNDQHQIINEVFTDDNVVEGFRDEKTEESQVKKHPEDVDLHLPGWGNWSGKGMKQSSHKKRRFIMKISNKELRHEENKGGVVIIREKSAKVKQHLVSELLFPFTRVQDFEASVRTPLGRNFVPERLFSKLIQPAIKTKMGKIIEPMAQNLLVKTENLGKRKKVLMSKTSINKNVSL